MIIAILFPLVVFSQTTIPIPTGLSDEAIVSWSEGIEDFDGDGFKDVAIRWWVDPGSSEHFSVYSYKKNEHLLLVLNNSPQNTSEYAIDLDNDGTVEIIIKNKIFSFTGVGIKKKLP